MQLNPAIRALVDQPGSLHAQQDQHAAAFTRWRDSARASAMFADFSAFAAGSPLSSLPSLAALFGGSGTAHAVILQMCGALVPILAEAPFGQVPLRHHVGRTTTTLMLAREAEASLTLVALDAAALAQEPEAVSVAFAPAEEWDVVLSGTGQGRLVEHHGAPGLVQHRLALAPGLALGRDAAREALLVDRADSAMVLLRLRRRTPGPAPVRELDLASGAQLHQSAACARESRHEIAVALLGKMGRTDAAPTLAEIARDCLLGDMLRWQALRECLALDTLAGFTTLSHLSCQAGDPLAAPAGALRAQLIELYPVLSEIEPCPA